MIKMRGTLFAFTSFFHFEPEHKKNVFQMWIVSLIEADKQIAAEGLNVVGLFLFCTLYFQSFGCLWVGEG